VLHTVQAQRKEGGATQLRFILITRIFSHSYIYTPKEFRHNWTASANFDWLQDAERENYFLWTITPAEGLGTVNRPKPSQTQTKRNRKTEPETESSANSSDERRKRLTGSGSRTALHGHLSVGGDSDSL